MRLGTVIGRVTLSQTVPALRGARWLLISPFTRDHFPQHATPPGVRASRSEYDSLISDKQPQDAKPLTALSAEPTPVVYDDLGGGLGDTIGYIEGREAAMPFDTSTPIDAINAAIIDEVNYNPLP